MSRSLTTAIALLVTMVVGACRAEPVESGGIDDDGLAVLWVDGAGEARLDVTGGTDGPEIPLPDGDPTWVSFGADDTIALTRAAAAVALRNAKTGAWRDLKATDASGDAPPGPGWFASWAPDGGRLALLAGDLSNGGPISVVLADPATETAFTIPVDEATLAAPPAWLDDDRVVIVTGDADAPLTRIVDAASGSLEPGPSGARFVAISTDGSTVATLAPSSAIIALDEASAWLAGNGSSASSAGTARAGAPAQGATPIAFALDAAGDRLAAAWRRTDGTVVVAVHARAQDWAPVTTRTFDDRARGAVVGWLR